MCSEAEKEGEERGKMGHVETDHLILHLTLKESDQICLFSFSSRNKMVTRSLFFVRVVVNTAGHDLQELD